jgi:hypothetical protein
MTEMKISFLIAPQLSFLLRAAVAEQVPDPPPAKKLTS